MSFAAVYNVTRGLRMLLHSQLSLASPTAVVTLLPPGDKLPEVSGVNLYLYRVNESPFTKNKPWPGDRITPASNQPALGLQLFYLLTPLGVRPDDTSFTLGDDSHTMLGIAMTTLEENPILNDVHIPGFDADNVLPDFFINSFEQIKITLVPTNLEELSKIWATINQPYRLSIAYEVSVVQLTPTVPPPVGSGVVLAANVDVITLDSPRLTALNPPTGALAHEDGGGNLQPNGLTISGFGFVFPGQNATVRIGGQPAAVTLAPPPTNTALTVTLPISLDAGPQEDVRVTLNGRTSTPLAFNVSPWLERISPIRTALDAPPTQLVLNGVGFTGTPQAVRLDGPSGVSKIIVFDSVSDAQITVTLPPTLANGLYTARVVLTDAVQSASNGRILEVIPRLAIPIGLAVVTVSGNQVHQLTMSGARLNGADLRVIIDDVNYQVDQKDPSVTAGANQLVYPLKRLLPAGPHNIAVRVNGQMSRTVALQV
jgi:hypothetical protein